MDIKLYMGQKKLSYYNYPKPVGIVPIFSEDSLISLRVFNTFKEFLGKGLGW